MRYQKPETMELGVRTKKASGGFDRGCVSGVSAGSYESCGSGVAAEWSCITGGSDTGQHGSCFGGSSASPSGGDCLSGSAVAYYCENGSGGNNDPYGCQAGISFA